MTDFTSLLRQHVQDLGQRLEAGLPTDREGLMEILDLFTEIHQGEALVTRYGSALVTAAMKAGVPQVDLIGRPYHETQVRRLAKDAGIPPRRQGRPKVRVA